MRNKYYRLNDGRYLVLAGDLPRSVSETLDELIDDGILNPDDYETISEKEFKKRLDVSP